MLERRIIIGLITSTQYLNQIRDFWDAHFLDSDTAKLLAGWIWEYYETYGKAPNRDIEGIFFKKVEEGKIKKELSDEIEQEILPGLSEEHEKEGFNVEYLIDETKKYFSSRHIKLFTEKVNGLIEVGNLEEAEKEVNSFAPMNFSNINLEDFIVSLVQIRKRKKKQPSLLLKPWLREGQTTIIYGSYGCGKSLLSILIAYLLGLRDYTSSEAEIGEWQVKTQSGTLYIDGELGESEMEERIDQFEWLGPQQSKFRIRILSIPEYQLATEDQFYLSKRSNQLKIIEWLKKNPAYKLVILDSASTLFGLEEENDNSEWNNKINPFLRDLRALGVACILLHHAGKDNKKGLRGASAMGAMAHNIFRLTNHGSKVTDEGEAWFTITKDKQRAAGFKFSTFSLKFRQRNDDTETHWQITDN